MHPPFVSPFLRARSFAPLSLCLAFAGLSLPTLLQAQSPAGAGPVANALQPFVDDHVLAGAVTLVANKDQVLDVETVGSADVAAQKPMSADDLFWIASMSKPLTATAFMMLVDEGKAKVDDPVEKYLPEFKGQMVTVEKDAEHKTLRHPKHPITIKNLLTHTSGLPHRSAIEGPTLDQLPLETRVRSYAAEALDFEPDTKFQYANAGLNTVGRLIEVLSGMSYEDFMKKRLFEPLGMKDTTSFPSEAQIQRLAKSYKGNKDKTGLEETVVTQLKYPLTDASRQPMPAGGFFSTAADLARFCQMILNNGEFQGKRLLSESAVREMTSLQTGDLPNTRGLGWAVGRKPTDPVGHGGAYSTDMSIDRGHGLITIFLVQNAGWRNAEGKKILPAFHQAALTAFGK